MDTERNYGLIIRHLRLQASLSVRIAAKKIEKSIGWLSEIENSRGKARLNEREFNRIVDLLGGKSQSQMFKTWVAIHKNSNRVDRTFDGAVLKFIRRKKAISLACAATLTGLSVGYLSKIERGIRPTNLALRNQIISAYGYSPSSFKNLNTDPVRSKAVPLRFKLEILIRSLTDVQIEALFGYARELKKRQLQVAE